MESVPLLLSLLILCVSGPSLCGATDYYVRPTEPTNASCPGQPCLILHHYIQNLSSNANYHLLPGVHFINGPITLKHVHNVSMAAFNSSITKIAATIECNRRGNVSLYNLECSGISFQDASNITISSLSIELKLLLPSDIAYRQLSIAGMSFMNSTDVVIQGLDVWITKTRPVEDVFVIAFSDCMDVKMRSFTFTNGGIDVTLSSNVSISNANITSLGQAIHITQSTYVCVSNGTIISRQAIYLNKTSFADISNVVIPYSNDSAMYMYHTEDTTINDVTIHSAGRVGIEMIGSTRSTVSGVHVMQSNGNGISMENNGHDKIENSTIANCVQYGINTNLSDEIVITRTAVFNSSDTGIYVKRVRGIIIANTTVSKSNFGIFIEESDFCHIRDTLVIDSYATCIELLQTYDILISNTRAMHAGFYALYIVGTTNCTVVSTALINASVTGASAVISQSITFRSVTMDGWTQYAFGAFDVESVDLYNMSLVTYKTTMTKETNGLFFTKCRNVLIYQSTFVYFPSFEIIFDINFQPAVIVFHNSKDNLHIKNCNFIANNITAVKVVHSEVRLCGSVNFTNNTAYRGAAMVFIQSGKMILSKDSHIIFKNNYAYTTGGAIYTTSSFTSFNNDYFIRSKVTIYSDCFMEVEDNYSQPQLTFQNNSAALGGDVVYGGSLGLACADPGKQEKLNRSKFCDTCIQTLKIVFTIENSTLSPVSSDPSRVCVCAYDEPDCLTIFETMHNNEHGIYPGQTLMISAVLVRQNFGTVAGSVYAQFVKLPSTDNTPQLAQRQDTQGVEHTKCNLLQYTICSQPGDVTLMLTAVKLKEIYNVTKETFKQRMKDYHSFPPRHA